MTKLSIIGVDAKFADAKGVDRFDRFIYSGKALNDNRLQEKQDLVSLCQLSVTEMAANNSLSIVDIALVVVCEQLSDLDIAKLEKLFLSVTIVLTLGEALEVVRKLTAKKQTVAIVGIQLQAINTDANTDVNADFSTDVMLQKKATISFGAGFKGYAATEGIASILIASNSMAKKQHAYVYASIKGFATAEDVAIVCHQAMDDSLLNKEDVKFIEVSALADSKKSQAEVLGLTKAYRSEKTLQTAITSVRSVTGEGGCFTQIAGLLKTVIALHQRYYAGISDWEKPSDLVWQQSPFYFPTESRPCFPNSNGKPLAAAYSCMTESDYTHIVLQEDQTATDRSNGFIACSDLVLIPIAANTEKQIIAALEKLEKASTKKSLQILAETHYEAFKVTSGKFRICLLAETEEELLKEISLAKEGVHDAIENAQEWKTPKGSFFTSEPVGQNNDVAFMYPGIGATYVGLGRDIFHLFPEIYQPVAKLADDIGASLKDELLNPRSINRLGFKEIKDLDHTLRNSLPNIAECGVGFACVFTKIFEEVFKVKASFSTGYSMGEISMYAALGCWERPGQMSKRLAESDTFNYRLTGELRTLRQHWDLPPAKEGDDELLWETYTMKATPEEVAEACIDEDRVYCTIINTPDSLVIGGYPEACQRVIKKLGVRAMPLDMANAIHSAPAFKEYEHMEELYTMDVTERIATKMYSSSCYLPVPQRTKAIANSIAKCLCDPVDFPRLINAMYDKGARIFIEMGPGRSLCSWIDKILKHDEIKPHVSVPVNAKGTSDELTVIRAIAKLVSHGVDVDISKLYYGSLVTSIGVTSEQLLTKKTNKNLIKKPA